MDDLLTLTTSVAYDIEHQYQPREDDPNRPQVIQSCDCFVDRNGLMYLTDPQCRALHEQCGSAAKLTQGDPAPEASAVRGGT